MLTSVFAMGAASGGGIKSATGTTGWLDDVNTLNITGLDFTPVMIGLARAANGSYIQGSVGCVWAYVDGENGYAASTSQGSMNIWSNSVSGFTFSLIDGGFTITNVQTASKLRGAFNWIAIGL